MCNGPCEGICSTEVAKECPQISGILASLAIPTQTTVDDTWSKWEETMLIEERMRIAVDNGGTGFSLMMGQY